jgi:hypothetical protein
MGRMAHSSTLLILCPWSHLAAPGLHYSVLSCKSCFPAHTRTWNIMFPLTTWPAAFTMKHQGNWCPCVSRTNGSCCSTSNRMCKPSGLVPPAAVSLNCTPWSLCEKSGPGTPVVLRLGSLKLAAVPLNCAPCSLCRKSSPRTPTIQRLGSSVPAATAVATGSPCPNASTPQDLHCLVGTQWYKPACFAAPWVPSTCYTVPGDCLHTPKWIPVSRFCYSADARRLPSPQNTEAQHSPLSLTAGECLLPRQSAGMPDFPLREGKL